MGFWVSNMLRLTTLSLTLLLGIMMMTEIQGSGYYHHDYGYDTDYYRYRNYYPYIGYDYSGSYGYSYAAPYDHGYDYSFLGHTGPGFYTFKGDKDDFIYGKKNKGVKDWGFGGPGLGYRYLPFGPYSSYGPKRGNIY